MGGLLADLGGSTARIPSFSAIPGNLPVSLDRLLENSIAPSWQAPDTLGELPIPSASSRRTPCEFPTALSESRPDAWT
ncbi:hypothetical protein BHM03_00031515 [Ensete ventricosum]|nr:hypothetical protein BHM03_00031515 [Ensete ventricosum]